MFFVERKILLKFCKTCSFPLIWWMIGLLELLFVVCMSYFWWFMFEKLYVTPNIWKFCTVIMLRNKWSTVLQSHFSRFKFIHFENYFWNSCLGFFSPFKFVVCLQLCWESKALFFQILFCYFFFDGFVLLLCFATIISLLDSSLSTYWIICGTGLAVGNLNILDKISFLFLNFHKSSFFISKFYKMFYFLSFRLCTLIYVLCDLIKIMWYLTWIKLFYIWYMID